MAKSRFADPDYAGYPGVYRYLPGELLTYVAKGNWDKKKQKAYSVATFYENFSFGAKRKIYY